MDKRGELERDDLSGLEVIGLVAVVHWGLSALFGLARWVLA